MDKLFTLLLIFSVSFTGLSLTKDDTDFKDIIILKKDTIEYHFVQTPDLFTNKWHLLPQPLFWKKVMKLSPDSCVLNVARTRQILRVESLENWNRLTDDEKELARVKLREVYNLDSTERIFMTTGKRNFYQFDLVYSSIKRAIKIFKDNDTDPWFAQAILMIESPGKLEKSVAGAYGPFQLMKSVARKHGLRVDKYVDERKDFDKSAYGSAHLLRTSCIPEAKRIMRKFGVIVTTKMEKQLWFRLLVLHNYHAGAGNVENVLTNVVKPNCGCQSVITKIWQSTYGRFGNSSQNYSQLALASLLVLDEFISDEN
ncbi:MAG TPA: lytic transglycosylase domain-containing protein [Crocinitomix sp.]|nr:lytic transglycosylase domain-containing protein [Crocinitomix sp.]